MSSVASTTTVTMTMTYIPVQTPNSNNKLLYVPVNSIQASLPSKQQQQQQQQQQTKDGNDVAKTVLLSSHPQTIQTNIVTMTPNSRSDGAFTTVRIQGGTQNTLESKSPFLHGALKQEDSVMGENSTSQGVVNPTTPHEVHYSQMATSGRKEKRKQTHLDRMGVSIFGGGEISSPVHKKRRGRPPSCEYICLYYCSIISLIFAFDLSPQYLYQILSSMVVFNFIFIIVLFDYLFNSFI